MFTPPYRLENKRVFHSTTASGADTGFFFSSGDALKQLGNLLNADWTIHLPVIASNQLLWIFPGSNYRNIGLANLVPPPPSNGARGDGYRRYVFSSSKTSPSLHAATRAAANHPPPSLFRIQLAHPSCDSPHTSRQFALGVRNVCPRAKTRRAPSEHCRHARVYGHTTMAMHEMSTVTLSPPHPFIFFTTLPPTGQSTTPPRKPRPSRLVKTPDAVA